MTIPFEEVARRWASRRFDVPIDEVERVVFTPENGAVYSEYTEDSPYVDIQVVAKWGWAGNIQAQSWVLPDILEELIVVAQTMAEEEK